MLTQRSAKKDQLSFLAWPPSYKNALWTKWKEPSRMNRRKMPPFFNGSAFFLTKVGKSRSSSSAIPTEGKSAARWSLVTKQKRVINGLGWRLFAWPTQSHSWIYYCSLWGPETGYGLLASLIHWIASLITLKLVITKAGLTAKWPPAQKLSLIQDPNTNWELRRMRKKIWRNQVKKKDAFIVSHHGFRASSFTLLNLPGFERLCFASWDEVELLTLFNSGLFPSRARCAIESKKNSIGLSSGSQYPSHFNASFSFPWQRRC